MTDPRLRITPPPSIKEINAEALAQYPGLPVLTVVGRRSGQPRSVPLTVHEVDGALHVVGGFPAADRIANARAAGIGTLTRDGAELAVRIIELPAADAEPVLRAWPEVTPIGVDMMRDAGVVPDTSPTRSPTSPGSARCSGSTP